MNVQDIDLNLLIGFDALLDEMSVSKAAQRLGVTQPAMSSTLKRLRRLFADPLLVRSSEGMQPTEKAIWLKTRVQRALAAIQSLIDEAGEFDPSRIERTIHIGLNDYASLLVIPQVYALIHSAAPQLKLVMHARKNIATARSELESGALDFVIGIGKTNELPSSLMTRKLFDDPFLTMMRNGHPALSQSDGTLSFETYMTLEHMVVSPQGHSRGIIDELLAKQGLFRHIAVTVPHFASAAQIVAATDLVCTIPGRIAAMFAEHYDIRTLAPPLDLPIGNVHLAWHAVSHENPIHKWIRTRFALAFP